VKYREGKTSPWTLVFLAVFSLLLYFLAERSQKPQRQPNFYTKLKAAQISVLAQEAIKEEVRERGLEIDPENDPTLTGLIGPQYTLITTDRGELRSKLLSTNPNFAAAVVDMFSKAGLKEGEVVAICMTGSFPSLNISCLAACKAMGLEPIVITSVGASTWGANRSELTWLDMETILNQRGILPCKSIAASLGGGNDRGRGLSPEGRELIKRAVERNKVELVAEETLEGSVRRRIEIFDRAAGEKEIAAFVNIGGGLASVGSTQNRKLIPTGLTRRLGQRNFPARGVINVLAERGIPVIHLVRIGELAEKYDLPGSFTLSPEIGEGSLFFRERYSISTTTIYTAILLVVVFVFIRIDVKHYLVGRRRRSL
jgi:poly-gamma-glutamate system protein